MIHGNAMMVGKSLNGVQGLTTGLDRPTVVSPAVNRVEAKVRVVVD